MGSRNDSEKVVALDQMRHLNEGRLELIQRQVRGQLGQSEVAELENLQAEATRLADILAPLPSIDHLVADVERLKRQILEGEPPCSLSKRGT